MRLTFEEIKEKVNSIFLLSEIHFKILLRAHGNITLDF